MFIRTLQNRVVALLGLATVVIICTGCPSVPTLTTAKTVGDGVNEIAISPGFTGVSVAAFGAQGAGVAARLNVPEVALGYRRGIGDKFDLGVVFSGWGHLRVDGKINFIDTDSFALALNPAFGGTAGYIDFSIPVPMDIVFTDWMRLTLQPRYMGLVGIAGDNSAPLAHFVGAGMGLEFVVSDMVALQPHGGFDLMMNPPGTSEVGSDFMFVTGGFAIKLRF